MTMTPPRQKVDRDEVFLEYTKSVCPVCKTVIDAEVNVKDNRVFLRKWCKDHGKFEALLYSDAEMYFASLRYNKPGTIPLETQTEVKDGCPLDCGLCPQHKQHACLGIIEVNSNCNLDCPICFADSGHQPDGFSLTMDQVETALDAFVRSEGEPEVVMFSGGEPTIHPLILDFIKMAKDKGVHMVTLNTNGIRLAHDRKFVADLAELKPLVYMQFDGFEESTHVAIRGRDLRAAKEKALANCAEFGINVSLVAAIEKGLNEHEIGDIVRFGVKHPAVRSVAYQPVTHSGRMVEFDPMQRLTNADIIHGLADQVPEWFKLSDFVPVPCCFPTCRSITYLLVDEENVVPIPRLVNVDDYLDYVSNRVMPDMSVRGALEKLWSASAVPAGEAGNTTAPLECATCGIDLPEALKDLADKSFMVVIQDFQDPYTLNVKALMKCCVEELTPDGKLIPFCAYNSVGYREQVREQLSGVPIPTIVPNAADLQPVLLTTRYGSKTYGNGNGNGNGHAEADATNIGKGLR